MTEWQLTSSELEKLKDWIIQSLKFLPNELQWGPPGDFELKIYGQIFIDMDCLIWTFLLLTVNHQ